MLVQMQSKKNNILVKEAYKILIVDDHKIFRECLVFVISQMEGFKVVGEASNGNTFLEMIDGLDVDIVLMDISMPGVDGITATTKALEMKPDLKIIALSMFCDNEYYYRMIQAGVSGYLLKETGKEELFTAMNLVISGEKYFSPKLLHNLILNSDICNKPFKPLTSHEIKFTMRETEILTLVCHGLTNLEISEKLNLSLRTVEGYKSNLINKTGTKNSIGLVVYALKNHLLN